MVTPLLSLCDQGFDRVGSPSWSTRVHQGSIGGKVTPSSETGGEDPRRAGCSSGVVANSVLCSSEGEFLVEDGAA